MKKFIFILSLALVSCHSNQVLVQKSDVAIATQDTSRIWFLDKDQGPTVYRMWKRGNYGKTCKVYLVDSISFEKLRMKAIAGVGYTTMISRRKTEQ